MPIHCSPANFPSHHPQKPSSLPLKKHSLCEFKSVWCFHLQWKKKKYVNYGCNSSVSDYIFLQHRCRFDSVSCKSFVISCVCLSSFPSLCVPLLCEKMFLGLCTNKKKAAAHIICLLCMTKQLLWCSKNWDALHNWKKYTIKSEVTMLNMDTYEYRPFVRQNETYNCYNWLLRSVFFMRVFLLEIFGEDRKTERKLKTTSIP